jgi:hypothetical protein
MKNLLKLSLVAAIALTTVGAYANNDDLAVNVKTEKEKNVRVFITESQDINVTIYGADNEVLYQKKSKALRGSSKTYDLSAFPDGNYSMKVESGSKLAEYSINIENDKASVSAPSIKELFKPVLTNENGVITLDLDNADKSAVEVQILDEYNDQVYANVFKDSSKLVKKFDTAKTPAKKLTFIVKSKNQEYNKTINVR